MIADLNGTRTAPNDKSYVMFHMSVPVEELDNLLSHYETALIFSQAAYLRQFQLKQKGPMITLTARIA